MSNWTAKARAYFSNKGQVVTPKTPKTLLLGVLGVPPLTFCEKTAAESDQSAAAELFSDDDRHCCTACRFLWPGNHCLQHRRAGLTTRDLAADFTQLMQRCPGYAPRPAAQAP